MTIWRKKKISIKNRHSVLSFFRLQTIFRSIHHTFLLDIVVFTNSFLKYNKGGQKEFMKFEIFAISYQFLANKTKKAKTFGEKNSAFFFLQKGEDICICVNQSIQCPKIRYQPRSVVTLKIKQSSWLKYSSFSFLVGGNFLSGTFVQKSDPLSIKNPYFI